MLLVSDRCWHAAVGKLVRKGENTFYPFVPHLLLFKKKKKARTGTTLVSIHLGK